MTDIVIASEIAEYAADLGVSEVVHFTRNSGMLGIARHGALLARMHLPDAEHLRYVYEANAKVRRDSNYLGYVNLSIERINATFFSIAANKWYAGQDGLYWCLLAFAPEIIAHQGVLFATTNNMYSGVRRAAGLQGLKALYSTPIIQWEGRLARRTTDMQPSWPTCRQAEVLYPNEVPLRYLRTVYVTEHEHADEVHGWLTTFGYHEIKVLVRREVFE
jgi:hypothetical protein